MVEQKWILCDKRRGRSDKWSDYKTHIVWSPTLKKKKKKTDLCKTRNFSLFQAMTRTSSNCQAHCHGVWIWSTGIGSVCSQRKDIHVQRRDPCTVTWQPEMSLWESGALKVKTSRQRVSQVRRGQKSLYTASCYGLTSLTGQHKLSGHWHQREETGYLTWSRSCETIKPEVKANYEVCVTLRKLLNEVRQIGLVVD